MELDYKIIGKRIKDARCEKKWTQAYLAEMSGVEPSNISHIERAATKLSLPTLVSIANALDKTLDELVWGNLIKSSHVSIKVINDVLSDCSSDELVAISELIKTTKHILRDKNNS